MALSLSLLLSLLSGRKKDWKGDNNVPRFLFRSDWKCLSPHRSMIQACPSFVFPLPLPFSPAPLHFLKLSEFSRTLKSSFLSRTLRSVVEKNLSTLPLSLSLSSFSFFFSPFFQRLGVPVESPRRKRKGGKRTRAEWK